MIDQDTIKHHIGRSIVAHLQTHEYARFSEMRPKGVDTNLFTYHLKLLMKSNHVIKTDQGYTLGPEGLLYVDRMSSEKMKLRRQPKIISMLLIQDGYGNVLLQKRTKQPYINTWTLPYGKLHMEDASVLEAGRREARDKLDYSPETIRHVGDCYIVTRLSAESSATQTRTLAHILRFETDEIAPGDSLRWVKPLDLRSVPLAPAVEDIIARAFFNDDFFFEEFHSNAHSLR